MRISFFALSMLFCIGVVASSPSVRADEVVFKNGDRLTGKITTEDGTKLTIDAKSVGKITVDMKNVRTFSTDEPIDVVLADGTTIHEKVKGGPDGQIALVPAGAAAGAAPRVVPLSQIKKVNPPPVRWTGSVLVGGTLTRGNTDTDSFNASVDLLRRTDTDRITLGASYLFARQRVPGDGKHETVDDLLGKGAYDYFFTPKFYGYANVEAEHDVIAGLTLRLAPGVGAGYQWVDTPQMGFNTEAGAGVLYRKYAHDGDRVSASARLAYHFKAKLNDKLSLFNDAEYLPGLDTINDYYFDTQAGVRASISEKMFTEFKVDYRYDARPAPGRGPNDVRYILGVGWNF